jgi:hypothetical protein
MDPIQEEFYQFYEPEFDYDYDAYMNTFNPNSYSNINSNSNRDLWSRNGVSLSNEFTPDTYYCNQCLDPSGNQPDWHVYSKRCNGCGVCKNSVACSADATQRRIQNTVRVPQSEYLENLAGLHVYTAPIAKYGFVNWNQGSDRAEPGKVNRNVPSHGANSTKTSITRMRPGSCSAAGQGVDIKHGSYARYLARIKGRGPYRTQTVPAPVPMEGNKTTKYGISNSYRNNNCLCPQF